MSCQYIQWDGKGLSPCGEPSEGYVIKGRVHHLCPLHADFAKDAVNDYEIKRHRLVEKQRKDRIRGQIKQLQLELKA